MMSAALLQPRRSQGQVYSTIHVEETKGPPASNGAANKNDPNYISEGVQFGEESNQEEYLLPHFTMLVVGRPGAGKTYVIRQMLTEQGFYKNKFDKILIMSPSATKMGIPVPKKQMQTSFDLAWIEEKLMDINIKQKADIQAKLREANIIDKFDVERLNGQLMDEVEGRPKKTEPNMYAEKERFFSPHFFKPMATQVVAKKTASGGTKKVAVKKSGEEVDLPTFVDEAHQKLVKKMPKDMRRGSYLNILLIIDDMISQIKSNEFNPLLTQLIFNRRHLIINGMLSVMIVAQKFSMIPSRIRSNSNWLIMFKQNPNDLLAVYKDLVQLPPEKWEQIVEFVFGEIQKNRNHLGIWVEKDKFFIDFKPLLLQTVPSAQFSQNPLPRPPTQPPLAASQAKQTISEQQNDQSRLHMGVMDQLKGKHPH